MLELTTLLHVATSGPKNITPTSSISAGVTSVAGGISRGTVNLTPATINVTVTVSNRAPDFLVSVSVFGSFSAHPFVKIVPSPINVTTTVAGSLTVPTGGFSPWTQEWRPPFPLTRWRS